MMEFTLSSVGKYWWKGNLHSHTTISDGNGDPADVIERYRDAGWDFLAITDHRRFGYHDDLCEENFLVLPGIEGDVHPEMGTHHVVALGDSSWKHKHGKALELLAHQTNVGQHLLDVMQTEGGLTMYCHPVWSRQEFEDIQDLDGFSLFEIYNHLCEHRNRTGLAVLYWDSLLRRGRRIWGTATDDCHSIDRDALGGWVMVRSDQLTTKSILDALRNGHFYSSTGPEIFEWSVKNDELHVQCSAVRSIHFVAYESHGQSFHAEPDQGITEAVYHRKGAETFVRAECVDFDGRTAWTNPVFFV